jgi:hypothetical protein
LIGLAAHGREMPAADEWLADLSRKAMRPAASPHRLALLALAALGRSSPLFRGSK